MFDFYKSIERFRDGDLIDWYDPATGIVHKGDTVESVYTPDMELRVRTMGRGLVVIEYGQVTGIKLYNRNVGDGRSNGTNLKGPQNYNVRSLDNTFINYIDKDQGKIVKNTQVLFDRPGKWNVVQVQKDGLDGFYWINLSQILKVLFIINDRLPRPGDFISWRQPWATEENPKATRSTEYMQVKRVSFPLRQCEVVGDLKVNFEDIIEVFSPDELRPDDRQISLRDEEREGTAADLVCQYARDKRERTQVAQNKANKLEQGGSRLYEAFMKRLSEITETQEDMLQRKPILFLATIYHELELLLVERGLPKAYANHVASDLMDQSVGLAEERTERFHAKLTVEGRFAVVEPCDVVQKFIQLFGDLDN